MSNSHSTFLQNPIGKNWRFFKESVRNLGQVGTLIHSSEYLVRSLLADVNFEKARLIVELGAGSGCVTRELLRRMRPDAQLYSFELSPVFFEEIRSIADSRLIAIHGCATLAVAMLAAGSADCVISGLPMGNFDIRKKLKIVRTVRKVLKPSGRFSQFQYSLLDYRLMRRSFKTVKLDYTVRNFPPAFVYSCVSA